MGDSKTASISSPVNLCQIANIRQSALSWIEWDDKKLLSLSDKPRQFSLQISPASVQVRWDDTYGTQSTRNGDVETLAITITDSSVPIKWRVPVILAV